ncbi:uncharacterized protein LOC142228570 [Haematobia irritans]|uniref:uncharacterized protein LOC142228570 n=1 Tax=Haematobia irritans TaxID=7368 RepID=UPI003F4F630B
MHFKKTTKNHKFTYEEFTTLLARIEAVLNSRPLSPISEDPQELVALTPGHFLRGAPLVAAPEYVPDTLSYIKRPQYSHYGQCLVCNRFHSLQSCPRFLQMSIEEKLEVVRQKRYCSNCLAQSHQKQVCPPTGVCRRCGGHHHSLLHRTQRKDNHKSIHRSKQPLHTRAVSKQWDLRRSSTSSRNRDLYRRDEQKSRNYPTNRFREIQTRNLIYGAKKALEKLASVLHSN